MPASPPSTLPPWEQVVRVGRAQRALIWVFFAGLLVLLLPIGAGALAGAGATDGLGEAGALSFVALAVGLRIAMAICVYRVAAALGSKVAILWALGGFLPNLIGLLVLLVVNRRATRFLRGAGLKPGFMGVKVPPEPPPGYLDGLGGVFS